MKDKPLFQRRNRTPIQKVVNWAKKLFAKDEARRTPWEKLKLERYELQQKAREERVIVQGKGGVKPRKKRRELTRGAFAKYGQQFSVSLNAAKGSFPKLGQRSLAKSLEALR